MVIVIIIICIYLFHCLSLQSLDINTSECIYMEGHERAICCLEAHASMSNTCSNRNQNIRVLHHYQLVIAEVIKLLAKTHYSKNQRQLQ